MTTIPLFNSDGNNIGALPLPDSIFDVEFNQTLVHQAAVAEEANQRQGTSSTKQRSDVRGGGRKPWRQKGTGRSRQGTIRSPLWRGGGIVFGPHPRDFRKEIPVKMRRSAMRCVLSAKVRENVVIGLDSLHFEHMKTRRMADMLKALNLADTRRVLIILPEYDEVLYRSSRNIPSLTVRFAPNFSVRDALVAHKIVLLAGAVEKVASVWTPAKAKIEEGTAV